MQRHCRVTLQPLLSSVLTTLELRWALPGLGYRYGGKGGIWTTVDALNAALGIRAANDDEKLQPDQVF